MKELVIGRLYIKFTFDKNGYTLTDKQGYANHTWLLFGSVISMDNIKAYHFCLGPFHIFSALIKK